MALSSSTYYTNSIVGQMMAGADVNILVANSSPKYPVGQGLQRGDGNIYRYCHVGTATNAGTLVGPTTASGGATYGAAVVVAPASAVTVPAEPHVTAGSVGSHYVEVTIAAIAANKYQGSYMIVTRGTGVGETYRIVGNTATNTPVTGNLRIQLYEPIQVAFTAATSITIVGSPYTDCQATQTTSAQATGVLMATTTSSLLWAWVCTHGYVGCTEDATIAPIAGNQIVASKNTAGAYMVLSNNGTTVASSSSYLPIIGYCVTPGGGTSGATRQGAIYLQLE